MRWFALTGALAIGLFAVAMALILATFLETRMLERDAALSRDFVQSIANTQQVAPVFRGAAAGVPSEFFGHLAAMPDVLRANVWSTGRRVLWSSRAELIGREFDDNDELDESLAGRATFEVEHGPTKDEHIALLPGRSLDFVENYFPVYDEAGRELLGVVELYRQPSALFEAIRSGQRLVWGGAALGALFLYLCLIGFVRRAERTLREQRTQLVEAQALAMVGELSASVAHSIRNPLGSIRSTAELQQALGADAPAMADIMRHVDRIDRLLRELLSSLGVGDARQAGVADLASVIEQLRERVAPSLEAAHKSLRVDVTRPLGRVAADPLLMAQVFDSLLANADEATAAGDSIELSARRAGDAVEIVIRDSGRGLGALRGEQLLEPLFTTKPSGLGMGLALVRRVIARLGGQIALENGAGGGAVVTLTLPIMK